MTDLRVIIEMGMGNDLHGGNYTKAASRAINDAMRRSTLPIFNNIGLPHTSMRVVVTIGVQQPEELDTDYLATLLPRGNATVFAVFGGQNVDDPSTGETAIIATAAIEAYLPDQAAHWRQSGPETL